MDVAFGQLPELEPSRHRPEDYDLVVFGSPVWFGSLSSPVRTYLLRHYDDLEEVAFFCTCASGGGERVLRQMADLCRKEPAATLILRQSGRGRWSGKKKWTSLSP
jgi:menaquinone-dependent protoporphyrinogen IX oxidase